METNEEYTIVADGDYNEPVSDSEYTIVADGDYHEPVHPDEEGFDWGDPSSWIRAVEGAGIASGLAGPIDKDIQEGVREGDQRFMQVANNFGEGVKNAAYSAAADATELASMLPIGDTATNKLFALEDDLRSNVDKNSVAELLVPTAIAKNVGKGVAKLFGKKLRYASPEKRLKRSYRNRADKRIAFEDAVTKPIENDDLLKKANDLENAFDVDAAKPVALTVLGKGNSRIGKEIDGIWKGVMSKFADKPLSHINDKAAVRLYNDVRTKFEKALHNTEAVSAEGLGLAEHSLATANKAKQLAKEYMKSVGFKQTTRSAASTLAGKTTEAGFTFVGSQVAARDKQPATQQLLKGK